MHDNGTLEVTSVRPTDVGEYTCSVVSPGGNETRTARLNVIELPYQPSNVNAQRVEGISLRTVNVSWVPGFDGNSPIKNFIVQKIEVPELGIYYPIDSISVLALFFESINFNLSVMNHAMKH